MDNKENGCNLSFLRLATLYFNPASKKVPDWTIQTENTSLQVIRSWEIDGKIRLLVGAVATLKGLPDLNETNSIIIPDDARRSTETVIEAYAHLISIGEMCECSISSPLPYLAFLWKGEEAKQWLDKTSGIFHFRKDELSFRFPIPEDKLMALLPDRLDGVALLAEALSHSTPTGKFNELIRVFENAFRTSNTPLVVPLSKFLSSNGQGYTEEEVRNWITVVRHQTRHADLKQQPTFLLSSETRPYITRVQQAAFDVIFNKATWHDISSSRRSLWKPIAFVGAPKTRKSVIIQHQRPVFEGHLIDGFGSYPIDLSAGITPIPESWWCKIAVDPGESESFSVNIKSPESPSEINDFLESVLEDEQSPKGSDDSQDEGNSKRGLRE